VKLFLRDLKDSWTSTWGTRVMSPKSCNVDLLGGGGGHSYEGPPLNNANGPAAGGSTSKSGGSTSKAVHGNLSSSLTQALQPLCNVIMPLTPTTQTCILQLFLDHPFSRSKNFIVFGSFLFAFFNWIFFILAGWPNFFPDSLSNTYVGSNYLPYLGSN